MRSLYLFVGGVAVGLAVQLALAQSQNPGIVSVNHIGVSVTDFDESLTYYTETMGFPEVFRIETDAGQPVLVFLQVSRNTFVELQPANDDRPPGLTHIGFEVEDMDGVVELLNARGAGVDVPHLDSGVTLTDLAEPDGIRLELLQFGAESPIGQAIADWR